MQGARPAACLVPALCATALEAQPPSETAAPVQLEALEPLAQAEPPPGYSRLSAEKDRLWGGPYTDPNEAGKLADGEEHEWAEPVPFDLGSVTDVVRSRLLGRPVAVGLVEDFLRFDLQGNRHRLSELWTGDDGRPVRVLALHWFAEWCSNCNAEAATLVSLHHRFASKGLRIVGMAEYSHPVKIREYIDKHQIPFLVLQGTPNAKDEDIRYIPEHYRYRRSLGDARKWGTPFTLFLERGNQRHVTAVLGEMRRIPAGAFLRAALGSDTRTD